MNNAVTLATGSQRYSHVASGCPLGQCRWRTTSPAAQQVLLDSAALNSSDWQGGGLVETNTPLQPCIGASLPYSAFCLCPGWCGSELPVLHIVGDVTNEVMEAVACHDVTHQWQTHRGAAAPETGLLPWSSWGWPSRALADKRPRGIPSMCGGGHRTYFCRSDLELFQNFWSDFPTRANEGHVTAFYHLSVARFDSEHLPS